MTEATLYLVKAVCDLLTIAILLNFFFRLFRVDYYNPIVRGFMTIIDPPARLARRMVRPIFNLDISSLIVSCITQYLAFSLVAASNTFTASTTTIIVWSF